MKTARAPWHRSRRTLVWGGVAVGAAIAVTVVFAFGPDKNPEPEHLTNAPVIKEKPQIKVPFGTDAKKVAMRFVQTAVARKNLAEAWDLSGPNVRGGLTRKEWMTGEIPVVPYPLDQLEVAPYKVDQSFADSALIEIALLPKKNAGVRSQIFFMQLKRVGKGDNARWVVDNWVPRASAVTPR